MPALPNATGGSGSESVSQLRAASYVTPSVCVHTVLLLLSATELVVTLRSLLLFLATLTADLFGGGGGAGGELVGE